MPHWFEQSGCATRTIDVCAGEETLNSDGFTLLTFYRMALRWELGLEVVYEDVRFWCAF